MGATRKTVLKSFGYLHCDDFAAYLTQMAAKGWHLKEWGIGLVFEKGQPEDVQYAVEVFIDGSEYDTRPGVHTLEFAQYCEATGWKLVDAKRKFVIFKKISEDAIEILTPRERLENIAKEERKEILSRMATAYIFSLFRILDLAGFGFTNYIFSNLFLLTFAICICFSISSTVRLFHYLFWKSSTAKKIENGESVRFSEKSNLFSQNSGWRSWFRSGFFLLYTVLLVVLKQYLFLIILLIIICSLQAMSYWVDHFRPEADVHQTIQAVVSVFLVMFLFSAAIVMYYTQNSTKTIPQEVPLYYEDLGADAGKIEDIRLNKSTSVLGSELYCSINYEEEIIYYNVYSSDHSWIIDWIWNHHIDEWYELRGDNVTDLFDAVSAVRDKHGTYLVKYRNAIWILDFSINTELSPVDVRIIQDALQESR